MRQDGLRPQLRLQAANAKLHPASRMRLVLGAKPHGESRNKSAWQPPIYTSVLGFKKNDALAQYKVSGYIAVKVAPDKRRGFVNACIWLLCLDLVSQKAGGAQTLSRKSEERCHI